MIRLHTVLLQVAILLTATALWSPWFGTNAAAARQENLPPVEVGAGPIGEPSLRLIGRLAYLPDRVEMYGFLTAATNLDVTALFTDAQPSVVSARFTFRAELTVDNRETRADVRMLESTGTLEIYQNEGGATWENLESFASGQSVARYSMSLRETLQRQDPTIGVVVGDAALTQEDAAPFVAGGGDLRFGDAGIVSRLRYTGALLAGQDSNTSEATVVGFTYVTEREAVPVQMGATTTP
ncbi:MAG: hypothetical protein U0031_18075 [Thermomicrobiales bacterium]